MQRFKKIILNIPHSSDRMLPRQTEIADGTRGSERLSDVALAGSRKNSDRLPSGSGWTDPAAIAKEVRRWTDWYTDSLFWPEADLANKVVPVVFGLSRFCVDVERLIDDPLNAVGQGILYERFGDCRRLITGRTALMNEYQGFISRLSSELTPGSLIVDCHSFPSDLADIDICIGYNDDVSKPDQEMIDGVARLFDGAGFKVGLNNPYSNSITPRKPIDYKSLMIEVNKRCYMNESTLARTIGHDIIPGLVNDFYRLVLA